MSADEMVWNALSMKFCSFKVPTRRQNETFCRNEYNITGLCSRSTCPLANSKYATLMEKNGRVYLYVKTAERAHTPKALWEKIPLSTNYVDALAKIDEILEHWPKSLIHRAKQRLTKITQYLIRKRKLELAGKKEVLVGIKKKRERRDARREAKALVAAKLDRSIEKELLGRLRSGTYGDVYNFPQKNYERVLAGEDAEAEAEDDDEESDVEEEEFEQDDEDEFVEEYEEEEEEDDAEGDFDDIEDLGAGRREPFAFDDAEDDEDEDGDNDMDMREKVRMRARRHSLGAKARRRQQFNIEVEEEREPVSDPRRNR